jgi:NADH:ubiquinone oxidoreductase subunit 5 (subunit L)/multisubunit Na+/H+ antiporter MnhA subunit
MRCYVEEQAKMQHQQEDKKMTAQSQAAEQNLLVKFADIIVLSCLNIVGFVVKFVYIFGMTVKETIEDELESHVEEQLNILSWPIVFVVSLLLSLAFFPLNFVALWRWYEDQPQSFGYGSGSYDFQDNDNSEQYQQYYSQDRSQYQQNQQKDEEENNSYDPFAILGVTEDMPIDAIKVVYRKLCLIYHPDVQGTGNKEKFLEIQEAWEQIQKIKGK